MNEHSPGVIDSLSPEAREGLERLLVRLGDSHEAVGQSIELMERLADSGVLAGANSMLEGFDENFNAMLRPDVMGMISNLMMVLGVLSQVPYEPFFHLAMRAPDAVAEAYPRFERRTDPLSLRQTLALMRTPEVGGALEMLVTVMRAVRTPAEEQGGSREA